MSKSSGSEDASYSPSYLACNEASTSSLNKNRKFSKKNYNERYDGQSPTSTPSSAERRPSSKIVLTKTKNSAAKGGYTEAPNIDYLFESDTDKKLDTQKESYFQQEDVSVKRCYDQCKVSQGMDMMGIPHLPGTLLSSKLGLVLNKAQKDAFAIKCQIGVKPKVEEKPMGENAPRVKSKSLPDKKLGDEHIFAYSSLKSSLILPPLAAKGKHEFTPPNKSRGGYKSTEDVSESGIAKALRLNSELLQKNKLLKRSSNDSKEEEKETPSSKKKRTDKEGLCQLKSSPEVRNDHDESRSTVASYPSESDEDYTSNTLNRVRKHAKTTKNIDDDRGASKFSSLPQIRSRGGSLMSSWTQTAQLEMVSVGTQTHEMSDASTQTDPIVYRSVLVQTDETECTSAVTQTILVCDTQSQTTDHHARLESGCQTTSLTVIDGDTQTVRSLRPSGTQTPRKVYREFNTQTSSIIGTEENNVAMRATSSLSDVSSFVLPLLRTFSADERYSSYSPAAHARQENIISSVSGDAMLFADNEPPLENWVPSLPSEPHGSSKNVNGRGVSTGGGGRETTENLDDLTANVLEARRHNQLNNYSPTMIERVLSMLHKE